MAAPDTTPSEVAHELVTALLDRDLERFESIGAAHQDLVYPVMSTAFTAAVWRHWPHDPSLDDVAGYAQAVAARQGDRAVATARTLEALMRTVMFRDPDLLQGIPAGELVPAQVLTVHTIQNEGLLEDRAEFLREVVESVERSVVR